MKNYWFAFALLLSLCAVPVITGCSGSNSQSEQTTPPATAPSISSISPTSVPVGSGSVTLTVSGSGFTSGTTLKIGTTAVPATLVSASQLTAIVPAALTASASTLSVSVSNGSETSSAVNLSVNNPVPGSITLTPDTVAAGGTSDVTIKVAGSNFVAGTVAQINGSPRTTSVQSSTSLSFELTATDQATSGQLQVTAINPGPGGGISAAAKLTITSSTPQSRPVISSVAPAGAPLNASVSVTVSGTGFDSGSTVEFDGKTISSSYVNSTTMTAQLTPSELITPGNHAITVNTPGWGISSAATFTAYIGLPNNAMALNPVNGLLYVSVPSAAGAPYGNSIVSVDPATGALGSPIYVGSEPGKLAISSDGTTAWVGLDGASAIRQVNLVTGKAGAQFSLGDNIGTYNYPPFVHAIAMLPGSTSSFVASVTTNNGLYEDTLAIYDNGVPRSLTVNLSTLALAPAVVVSPTKPEIYATSDFSGYQVFSYNSSGLTHLAGNSGQSNFNAYYGTQLQVDKGVAYLDTGVALNAETGVLLGTFYSSGTTVATGPMLSDSSQGKNFILELGNSAAQIQPFNESNFTPAGTSTIPVNGAQGGYKYGAGNSTETTIDGYNNIDTMVRWGANGFAFRAANGIFSLRSNVVHDLSATNVDLAVAVSAPSTAATGSVLTLTATVTNHGSSQASDVVLAQTASSALTFVSASPSQGSCVATLPLRCDLGSLANGKTASVTLKVQGTAAGTATTTVDVAGDQPDSVAINNTANASTILTGEDYAGVPVMTGLSPNAVQAGSSDQAIAVTGSGFVNGSVVYLGTEALSTTFVSDSELQANVPSGSLTNLGWYAIRVSNPAPGGGLSNALPLTVYKLINLTANHIVYDPYSRLLYASVASTATEITGNTVVTVNPATGSVGSPVPVGSQPSSMALTGDGNYLYVNETGANAVARLNTSSQQVEFSFPVTVNNYAISLRDVAAMPGSDDTIAVDSGMGPGISLWDVDPAQKTATQRGNALGGYSGSSLQFLNAGSLFSFDSDTTGQEFFMYTVGASGLSGSYTTAFTLNSFSAFKIRNGLAYANAGGVANPATTPVSQMGVFLNPPPVQDANAYSYYQTAGQLTEPDPSLGLSFFALPSSYSATTGGMLESFQQSNYQLENTLTLPELSTKDPSTALSYVDFVRWGQDGLALLTSSGQILVLRGGFVVPGLLGQNTAASLTSAATVIHGAGNTLLTLTGSNFLPGVAVTWNGGYRTTTIVNATHVTVALTAADVASAGTASAVATNPGAPASAPLTITVQ